MLAQPALIWGNKDRPAAFSGKVSVVVDDPPTNTMTSLAAPKAVSTTSKQSPSKPCSLVVEDADHLGTLLGMLDMEESEARAAPLANAPLASTTHSDHPAS